MVKIKNNLPSTFNADNIQSLVDYTSKNYRAYDPGQYLYKLAMDHSMETKFSRDFIELAYTTLVAWNMNQRGAKLSDYSIFEKSLIDHESTIRSLGQFRIEEVGDSLDFMKKLKFLYENLELVAEGKPKLVTFSKTLHFFLPNLVMPIDRSYTLYYFYKNTNVPKGDDRQFEIYFDIFDQFKQLTTTYDFSIHIDGNWHRNIPKIIDNLIIAFIQKQ